MPNFFDQFDAPGSTATASGGNPFDRFDVQNPNQPGLISTIKRTGANMASTAATAVEDITGKNQITQGVIDWGKGVEERNPAGIQSLSDIANNPLLTIKEGVGNMVAQMPVTLGASALGAYGGGAVGGAIGGPPGAAAGATIGRWAGAAIPTFLQEYGGIRQDQQEAGIDDKGRALLAAVPATAIEFNPLSPDVKAIRLMAGEEGKKLFGQGGKQVAKDLGKAAAIGAVTEGPMEEYPQSLLESWGAHKDPFTAQAQEQAAVGAVLGAVGGGAMGPINATASGIRAANAEEEARRVAAQMGVAPIAGTPASPAPLSAGTPATPAPPAAGTTVPAQPVSGSPSSVADTVAQAVAAEEAAANSAALSQGGAAAPSPAAAVPGGPIPAAIDPEIIKRRAQAYYDAGKARVDEGYFDEGLHLMEQGDAILRGEQPVPFGGATAAESQNPAADPEREKRARFYESMADEREARGDTEGIIKAAEYRQTAASLRAGNPALPTKGKNESGNQTEKAVKAKKGREEKPNETPDSTAVDVGGLSIAAPPDARPAPMREDAVKFAESRTDGQLAVLAKSGRPGYKEAAVAEIARRSGMSPKSVSGTPGNPENPETGKNWKSGTSGKSEDEPVRGAVGMKLSAGQVVTTLTGRTTTPFPKFQSSTGKMTQAHLNAVDRWLLSNAAEEAESRGDDFNALPFRRALESKTIPQADKDSAEMYLFEWQPDVIKPITRPLVPESKSPPVAANETATDAPQTPLSSAGETQAPRKNPGTKSNPPPIMRRDDLVGAIMRVTGGNGIHSSMAPDTVGDNANKATRLRGLFTNRGTTDLGDVAMLLRESESFDVRDGEHLSEMIRQASFGDVPVSMERQERNAEADKEKQHRDRIRAMAKKYKLKTDFVKFSVLEGRVLYVERQRHKQAVNALTERDKKRFEAAVQQLEGLVSEEEVGTILRDVNERPNLDGREKWKEARRLLEQFAQDARHKEIEGAIDRAEQSTTTEEPDWFKEDDDEADTGSGNGGLSAEDHGKDGDRVQGQSEPAAGEERESGVLAGGEESGQGNRETPAGRLELTGQTQQEAAAAEAEAKAQANREAKAKQEAEKAKKEAETKAEIKLRSEAAASTFELGGNAMDNLTGQGSVFDAPPPSPAPVKKEEPPAISGYKNQPESFDWAAKDVGGKVVYSHGDIALLEGFSLFGNPVYTGIKGDSRTSVDIESYTGKMFSDAEKAELLKARSEHIAEQDRLHATNPDGPFNGGARFAKTDGISAELAGVAQKWLSMLGIKSRVFLATKTDVSSFEAIDQYGLRGPFAAIRSAGVKREEDGGMRVLPNGDYYIILPPSKRQSAALETLAHEIGHILEKEEWKSADQATKDAVMADYQKWLATAGNTSAKEWVTQMRAHTTGKQVGNIPNTTADKLPAYWRSFGEYFADQVSKWATTTDKPLTAVDAFFKRVATAMRRLYSMLAGKPYLPTDAMRKYLDSRSVESPLEAPAPSVEVGDEVRFVPESVSGLTPIVSGTLVGKESTGQGRFRLRIRGEDGNTTQVYSQNGKVERIGSGLNAEDVTPADSATISESPSMQVSKFIQARLAENRKTTWQELFDAAAKAWGSTLADGKYSVKDAYDAMEIGVNLHIRSEEMLIDGDAKEASAFATGLTKLIDLLPTQTKRTAEQDEFQQFSTPPALSYVASWVANIGKSDTMMEPSAGTGDLAIWAEQQGAGLILNELSDRRAKVLQELFPKARVFTENAEQINNTLPADAVPTVVVMNPPFSSTAGRVQGSRNTMNGAKHIEQALKRLADGGRLVAIVGEGMAADRPAFTSWWKAIAKEYNVRANIGIDGKEYAKYGTTFSNQILVFDKTGPTTGDIVTGNVASVADLPTLLEGIRNDRLPVSQRASDQPEGAVAPEGKQGSNGPAPTDRGGATDAVVPGGKSGPATGSMGTTAVGGKGSGRGASETADPATGEGRPATTDATPDADGERGRIPDRPVGDGAGSGGNNAGGVDVSDSGAAATSEQGSLTDSVFENYTPQRLRVAGAKPHPGNLVQSAAMASVEPPAPTYAPNLPRELIDGGKLSVAQIESIVYAGQAHEQFLPNGERRGFFIGDGTGVGKGREIAGIILDNIRQGRKKAVWVSFSEGLINDAQRDFEGIGGDKGQIFWQGKTKPAQPIAAKEGILFTSYSTMKSAEKKQANDTGQKAGKTRLDQIVDWVGADFDGAIVFDEAHSMGNIIAMPGKRGIKKPSQQALAGANLQKMLPKARIVYVSATGATEVSNLGYASRLGLWGEGTAFHGVREFITGISQGGVAAMELISRDMKALGMYIARSLSFDGVTYQRLDHELTPLQTDIYNELARAWQGVLKNVNEALGITGGDKSGSAKSAAMAAFWGSHQRFFNQVITSLQTPTVIDDMRKQIAAGNALVVQLVNTNEATQEREVAKAQADGTELEELDFTPRQMLLDYVRNSFPVQAYQQSTDDKGNLIMVPVTDAAGNPVFDKDAIAMRERLLKTLEQIRVPGNPIDEIIQAFGSDAVGEVTGRKRRFVSERGEDGAYRIVEEKRGKNAAHNDAAAFQGDKKKILIFSQAGGTGFSFHADNTAVNKRKRVHYILQPGWRADAAVQGFGRSHRTNQASAPIYMLPTTNLKAQKRFVSSIARRLDQLGALTRGQRQATSQGMFSASDNLESQYASDALKNLFNDMYRGNSSLDFGEITGAMGLDGLIDQNGGLNTTKLPEIPQFLNRLLSLESFQQDEVFAEFEKRLDEVVNFAIQTGTYDTGLQTLQAQSIIKVRDEVAHTDPRTGAETRYVEVDVSNPIKYVTKRRALEWAKDYGSQFDGWFKDAKGEVFGLAYLGERVNSDGETTYRGVILKINGERRYIDNADQVRRGWRKDSRGDKQTISTRIDDQGEAMTLLEAQIKAAPKTRTKRERMVVGVILPVWDRVQGDARIVRLQTDSGERMIGRMMSEKEAKQTVKNLGLGASVSKMSTKEIVDSIRAGSVADLANGWQIAQVTVSGEKRLEIRNRSGYFTSGDTNILRDQGAFFERIEWKERAFIPTKKDGEKVFERITESKPVVDLLSKSDRSNDDSTRYNVATDTRATPADKAIYGMVADGKTAREILDFISKGSRRPFNRYLANALRNLGASSTLTLDSQGGWRFGNSSQAQRYAAAYNPKTDTVALFTARDAERHTLHELTHAATLKAIAAGGPASLQMRALFLHIKRNGSLDGQYGMSNLDEFVAEAFSNPKFQAALKAIPAPKGSALRNAWEWFVRTVARALGLKSPAMETALDRAMVEGAKLMRENAALSGQMDGSDRYALAWHGTPHVWAPEPGFPHGRPRLDKMGSGEGAQAYGWGWYSADSRDVATSYIGGKSGHIKEPLIGGKRIDELSPQLLRKWEMDTGGKSYAFFDQLRMSDDPQRTLDFYKSGGGPLGSVAAEVEAMGVRAVDAGALYRLDIPDDVMPNMLDWDKPLSDQTPEVRKDLGVTSGYSFLNSPKGRLTIHGGSMTGLDLYQELESFFADSKKKASEYLASIGIVGTRYLDGNSRSDGAGTHNYVIWDQKTLDRIALLERNGEKLDAIREADAARYNVEPLPDTITINGVERPTTNSNGKQIAQDEAGVRRFWEWFGESKVTDEKGRPLVLFHGATADFGADGAPVAFDFGRTADEDLSSGKGAYLTTSPEAASRYADGISWGNGGESDAPNVMPVYARIEAPFSKTASYRIEDFESVLPESVVEDAKNSANPGENFLEETQQAIDDLQSRLEDLQAGYLNDEIADEYRIDESDYDSEDEYQAAIEEAIEREVGDAERTIERYEGEVERAWADAKAEYSNTRLSGDEIWTAIKEDLPEYADWKNERQLFGGDSASIEMDTEVARILFDAFGFDGVKRTDKFPIKTQHTVYIANNAPTQIKSATGNSSQFDPANPDIRYSAGADWYNGPSGAPVRNAWQRAKAKAAEILSPKNLDKIIYEMQDKYVDLKRLRDHIKAIGGTITDMNDAYLGEELYHQRLAYRTEKFSADELLPLQAEMRAKGISQSELETFLHARHAPEANAEMAKRNPNQGEIDAGRKQAADAVRDLELQLQRAKATGSATHALERALNDARGELVKWNGAQAFRGTEEERTSLSGMSDAASAAILAGLTPKRRAELDTLAVRVDAINEGTLQLLDDYGLMPKAALTAWRNTYQHYIPLHRDEAHPDSLSHPIGQGFNVKGDAAKRRTGSNQKVTNILGHIAMQREAALTRGEKNHVMLKLYLMARQNPLPDVWKVGSVPTIDTIDKATGFVKSIPDPLYKTRPNVLVLRVGGKDVAITINEHNPEALRMAHALKNLDVDDLHYLIPVVGKATRWFASMNTQYNPIFGIINLMRDTQEAALNLSTTELSGKQGEILKDQLSILKEVLQNKGRMPKTGKWAAIFAELKEVGGTTGYRDLFLDAESRGKALQDTLKSLDRGKASQAAHAVADWLSDYNEAMENATRLAAYKAGIDSGMSKERAASLAKNLTVNFNRKGRQTRELGALYAFFNAAVQGTTRMAQTLAGPAGRKIMAGGVLIGALNALLGIAMMGGGDGDDDEWEKIPEFVKERSIIIPIGKQDYLSIPMPLGFQFLPNIGRLAVEMAFYKDKTAGKQMASLFTVLADAFNPLGGSSPPMQIIAPTVMDPFVALAQNKDWTGRPIYIENRNNLDPKPGLQRSKDSATPWAKGFAEAINAITGGTEYTPGGWSPTPDQIDYVIGQLTGGVGREAGKVASTLSAPLTGEELPAHKIPLAGRLYGSTSGTSGQSARFYENITRANAAESEIKGRAKDGLSVAEYLRENPGAVELAVRGNAAEKQVSALRKMRRDAVKQGGPEATGRVRDLNERMAAVMRDFNNESGKVGRRAEQ